MKKKMLKKSEVLREGYVNGLKHAQNIINEMIEEQMMNERFRLNAKKDATNLIIKYIKQCIDTKRKPDPARLQRISDTVDGKVKYKTLVKWLDENKSKGGWVWKLYDEFSEKMKAEAMDETDYIALGTVVALTCNMVADMAG